jgi:hypothetical protein
MTLHRHSKRTLRLRPLVIQRRARWVLSTLLEAGCNTIFLRLSREIVEVTLCQHRPICSLLCYQQHRGIEHAGIYVRAERLCSNTESEIFPSRVEIDETISKSSWIYNGVLELSNRSDCSTHSTQSTTSTTLSIPLSSTTKLSAIVSTGHDSIHCSSRTLIPWFSSDATLHSNSHRYPGRKPSCHLRSSCHRGPPAKHPRDLRTLEM